MLEFAVFSCVLLFMLGCKTVSIVSDMWGKNPSEYVSENKMKILLRYSEAFSFAGSIAMLVWAIDILCHLS